MRVLRSKLFGLLWSLAVASLIAPAAQAQQLTDFRAPNDLETAYIGAAAQLVEPNLCYKISDKALYRGRKPVLARSRCFYFIALNTRTADWCREVQGIPVALGMMNWLEPERCRYQVERSRNSRAYKVRFDHAAMLRALGYKKDDVPAEFSDGERIDWPGFFDLLAAQSDSDAGVDFRSRLAGLPDFNSVKRDQDKDLYFTAEQQVYEFAWTMTRGMKLCLLGRGSDNCNPKVYAMMREQLTAARQRIGQGAVKTGRAPASGDVARPKDGEDLSTLRRPADLERAYYDLALGMNDPSTCRKISPDAIVVGWTTEPGFLFMPLRAICLTALASERGDAALCDEVTALPRDDLDGASLTPAHCRRIVAGESRSPHRRSLSPNWEASLRAIGFTEAEKQEAGAVRPGAKPADWAGLAAQAMEPSSRFHDRLLARLAEAPNFDHSPAIPGDGSFYFEAELQKHLYQLTLVRFHCTVRDGAPNQAVKPPKLPDRIGEFALTDHNGRRVTEKTFRGSYLLVYFGYTSCPDVCPTDLSTMIAALDILEEPAASRIQPIFITLDPRRDTAEQLAAYVTLFHPRLRGLTGTPAEVRRAARDFGVSYYAGEVEGTYVVDHSAYTYLIDPDGRFVTYFQHGADPVEMAAVLGQRVTPTRRVHASLP